MNIQQAIASLIDGNDLSVDDMQAVMRIIMTGEATDAQIGGFLVALRIKGETVDEITGAASVMRELSSGVNISGQNIVDIVGTGGDGAKIFNVSTASSIVAAAAGATVAKHGNRSITSSSGSADLLEAAGVRLDLTPEEVGRCVKEVGLGFMFAVAHHGAMKHAIGPRKELAARTIFNLLGPLTNPAGVPNLCLGVYAKEWLVPYAEVLRKLGAEHVLVAHSQDGLDEISIAAPTDLVELKDGEIREFTISPADFGLTGGGLSDLVVDSAADSLALIKKAFNGEAETARQMVAINAGAALYVAGVCADHASGIQLAEDVMASGQAAEKLQELVQFTEMMKSSA